MNSFDIDGVIWMGREDLTGIFPSPRDVIVTGRSWQEREHTIEMLTRRGIRNPVFFNPRNWSEKTRESSGQHKGEVIATLSSLGYPISLHFEDDPVQANFIRKICPWVTVVMIEHDLVTKENAWHGPENERPAF